MTFTHCLSTNNYGESKFIVSPNAYEGTHTTIQAAITAASSGDTVFIRANSSAYTENLTLKVGVNLCAYESDSLTPNVTIIGTCTLTTAGTVTISGIRLQTNNAAAIAVTGSAASILNLENCYLNFSNNTGITFSSSSPSAQINIRKCTGDLGTTGIGLFTHTSAGTLLFQNNIFNNSGASTTANTASAGALVVGYTLISNPTTTSATNTLTSVFSQYQCLILNTTALTLGGTNATIDNSSISSGTATAISISTTATITNVTVNSSNAAAIAGAGTIIYSGISFQNTSSIITTTTQTPLGFNPGQIILNGNGTSINYKITTLTSAQIKALHATPIEVIPAQGAGKVVVLLSNSSKFIYGGSNVFVAGSGQTIQLAYGTTPIAQTAVVVNAVLTGTTSVYTLPLLTTVSANAFSAFENVAIKAYNSVVTEISGNAANDNSVILSTLYYVMSI